MLLWATNTVAETSTNKPEKWVVLEGCRFVAGEYGDGDSFHVKYGQREFIFRLYFVDAPETDEHLKDRIREQCTYFGVAPETILKFGTTARQFSATWLQRPFTVTTRWQNAMGRSRLPRYYALITVSGFDLAELLVTRGLARVKGTVAVLPDGTRAKDHVGKLRKLEAEAKTNQCGIWAGAKTASEKPQKPISSSP